MYTPVGAEVGQKRGLDLLELKLLRVVSHQMWVLDIRPKSSGRIAIAGQAPKLQRNAVSKNKKQTATTNKTKQKTIVLNS